MAKRAFIVVRAYGIGKGNLLNVPIPLVAIVMDHTLRQVQKKKSPSGLLAFVFSP